jgi:hypothetical protein
VRTTVGEETFPFDAFIFLMNSPLAFNPATGRLAPGSSSYPGAKLSWPAVTPHFAPDDETPR